MQKKFNPVTLIAVLAFIGFTFVTVNWPTNAASRDFSAKNTAVTDNLTEDAAFRLYDLLSLDSLGLQKQAFELAVRGWEKLKQQGQISRDAIMTIADFSQPSARKRLYVLDLESGKLLYNTYVAHGRNSGREMASSYSNRPSSYKSSPGFYRTEETYYGSNGYSLRLEGLEKGINDNADRRAIVMHGAPYVNEKFISQQGFIGRSQGCPAIPQNMARPIINAIKGGSCLFIYSPAPVYAQQSQLVR
ncbi:murein L,D-transpeptidase catalytic domain family protein [Flavihumibacter petaseus]|uniref:YkuD domain-containing protein n=1 Tax=Flavihumibacter petaseus NBRC 106054 TaxID=1220578 RepID=A0A0E9MU29_9BACT|nr:murein L,D-transpeptidase catalytic domain family protein [Flavihumibacter petaseus]GAO41074.1 hypothetical protein FPE01S_01_00860 [Flavihumibacter petaseus NBRC 106054]